MRVKFNRFEKVAGLFVLVAVAGFVVAGVSIAIQKGWFSSKVHFVTSMRTADGIHPGTAVQMSGLRAGAVDQIDLVSGSEVKVHFYVLDKFAHEMKQDSVVQVIRPFVIGDKILDVSVGSDDQPFLAANSAIPCRDTFDIMDILGGRTMNNFASSFNHMAESIRIFADAFADPERSKELVKMIDRLSPMIKNLNAMTVSVTKVTDTANRILPEFSKAPDVGKQMAEIVENLNVLTAEFKKLTPAINEVAPDLPRTTKRAVEALDQTVILLKAMQRSWILRGNVKDVKAEEEKENQQEKVRAPADTK